MRFDGIAGTELIDRKISLHSSRKGKLALQRQFEALKQNKDFTLRIEVPRQAVKNRIEKVMKQLEIESDRITVMVVPE